MYIYKITNLVNNKIYIGKTINSIKQRWQEHLCATRRGSNFLIHKAIRKYGKENFKIEIIDTAPNILILLEKEKHFIKQFNCFNNTAIGYNLTEGGEDGCMSDSICKARSERMKGKYLSKETKQKISQTKLNNPLIITDEYRNKIRLTSLGRIFTKESIEKRAVQLRGRKRTPEQREKMRLAKLGRKLTAEHKQNISQSLKNNGK